ncbi:MAG: hypothetical protein Q4E41_01485 [Bacteroidales bacterium]|nr:hypothetical protein [Bacteroidales bacterium]
MKRYNNTQQITLDFEHPENNYLTVEQIIEREEENKRKVDFAVRKLFYIASFLVILANIIM